MLSSKTILVKYIISFVLLVILVFMSLTYVFYRPCFKDATANDYEAINGIGKTTASEIVLYIQSHPDCNIQDLDNVPWIGENKLELIRKEFR